MNVIKAAGSDDVDTAECSCHGMKKRSGEADSNNRSGVFDLTISEKERKSI